MTTPYRNLDWHGTLKTGSTFAATTRGIYTITGCRGAYKATKQDPKTLATMWTVEGFAKVSQAKWACMVDAV